jgi:hypothetical protein
MSVPTPNAPNVLSRAVSAPGQRTPAVVGTWWGEIESCQRSVTDTVPDLGRFAAA